MGAASSDNHLHNRFPGSARIKKNARFLVVQRQGRKLYSKHFLVIVEKNGLAGPRLGVTITRKIDMRATVRNRLRRRIREIFRTHAARLRPGFDILVIARNNAPEIEFRDLKRELLGALRHAGFLRPIPGAEEESK